MNRRVGTALGTAVESTQKGGACGPHVRCGEMREGDAAGVWGVLPACGNAARALGGAR